MTASHSWNVPAGSTRQYKVRALSADSKYFFCPFPYWSDPLIVTVTGPALTAPSIFADELFPEMDENESDYDEVLIEDNESEYENVSP